MTAQEKIQIRQLKKGQEEILKSQTDFHTEIREEIDTLKTMIGETYVPQKWVRTTIAVAKWLIATIIAIAGLLAYWKHK